MLGTICTRLAGGLAFILVLSAAAPPPAGHVLPPYVALPPETVLTSKPGPDLRHSGWGELELPKVKDDGGLQRGEIWHAHVHFPHFAKDPDEAAIFDKFSPPLAEAGWTILSHGGHHPLTSVMHYQKGGKDAWLLLEIYDLDNINIDVVEVKPQTVIHKLKPAAAIPEKLVAGRGDFPFLGPLPGSKFHDGQLHDGPMRLVVRSPEGKTETIAVGTSWIGKSYDLPSLTNVQFVTVYRAALVEAGWTILETTQSPHQTDATISAHYGKEGRDLWAALRATDESYTIGLADAGQDDIGAKLARECHVALYGVLFDFDQASLKPESEPTLTRVAALLTKQRTTRIEVQGHTDSVGTPDYNLKLSEARAISVVDWLTAHGIAADRLSAKGYGETMPIASNDTDDGRARNRRVEILDRACKK